MKIRLLDYRPPKIAQLLLLIAVILHWTTPLKQLSLFSSVSLASLLGVAGFGIMIWGWGLFKRHDAAISPKAEADKLVTSGIYRLTRNPMYLGMSTMMLAVAIYVGTAPFYVAAVIFFVIVNGIFCPYEEAKLIRAFGERYLDYQRRVRRWL